MYSIINILVQSICSLVLLFHNNVYWFNLFVSYLTEIMRSLRASSGRIHSRGSAMRSLMVTCADMFCIAQYLTSLRRRDQLFNMAGI